MDYLRPFDGVRGVVPERLPVVGVPFFTALPDLTGRPALTASLAADGRWLFSGLAAVAGRLLFMAVLAGTGRPLLNELPTDSEGFAMPGFLLA